jgi:hypothetical protein
MAAGAEHSLLDKNLFSDHLQAIDYMYGDLLKADKN